jgi:hypothetical protein
LSRQIAANLKFILLQSRILGKADLTPERRPAAPTDWASADALGAPNNAKFEVAIRRLAQALRPTHGKRTPHAVAATHGGRRSAIPGVASANGVLGTVDPATPPRDLSLAPGCGRSRARLYAALVLCLLPVVPVGRRAPAAAS